MGIFKKNPQISYPELNWRIFTLSYLREIKLNFLENLIIVKKFYAFLIPIEPRSWYIKAILIKKRSLT